MHRPPPPPPGGSPPHGAPEGPVSVRTAQRIVHDEVQRAVTREARVGYVVAEKVARATQKASLRVALLRAGVALTLLGAGLAGYFAYVSNKAARSLAAEVGLGKTKAPELTSSVPTQVMTGRQIYEQNRSALYVMGYTLGNRIGGCCTAFAIGPDLLATNAHCVSACAKEGGTPVVIQNDAGGKIRFPITAMKAHPAYRGDTKSADTPDVGLLRIAGKMPRAVTLANEAELRAIGPGDDAYVLGFPGTVMDPLSPAATFLQGRIGRVMGFREEATTPERAVLIQHDAVTRGGNSGSPIFDQYGHVIGVHTAHIDDEQDVKIDGKKITMLNASPFRIGMRIDLLSGVPKP